MGIVLSYFRLQIVSISDKKENVVDHKYAVRDLLHIGDVYTVSICSL